MDVHERRLPLPNRLLDDPLPIPQALHVAFEGGEEFGPAGSGVADSLDLAWTRTALIIVGLMVSG